jgi:N-acetylneuraminate lyase
MDPQNPQEASNGKWTRIDAADSDAFRLIPAAFTPMTADGSIDFDVVEPYAAYLVEQGISEAFVCGTTGEGLSLTVDERLALVEAWSACRDLIEPIAHVGHNCQRECIRMAAHAGRLGLKSIAAMATCFFRPAGERALVNFLKPIAAAAPEAKFYFYHMPSATGVTVDMKTFISMAVEQIPNFGGIKYTHEDLTEFGACVKEWDGQLDLLFGRDELLLEALALGTRGAVGSFYSLIPGVFQKMIAAHRQGHQAEARQCADYAASLAKRTLGFNLLPASKFLLSRAGFISEYVRPPLEVLSPESKEGLLESVASLGPVPHDTEGPHFLAAADARAAQSRVG